MAFFKITGLLIVLIMALAASACVEKDYAKRTQIKVAAYAKAG